MTYSCSLLTLSLWYIVTLNPASLLPISCDGEPHDFIITTAHLTKPHINLNDAPLPDCDLVYFADGSCLRNDKGTLVSGYAASTT